MSENLKTAHFTLKKEERLSSKKLMDELFAKNKSVSKGSLRLVFLETKTELKFPAQVVISISKKRFKKAVDRNKIKRLIREAYRLNKNSFYDFLKSENKKILLGIIFCDNKIPLYAAVEADLKATFLSLTSKLKS